ncbi:hypothetical protein Tco_0115416 [Tanacetum coccineum]
MSSWERLCIASLGPWRLSLTPNAIFMIFDRLLIIEQRVETNQKTRILELKRRNYEEHCSDILYAVSIKEDTVYPCLELHSASTKEKIYTPYPDEVIRRIQCEEDEVTEAMGEPTMEEYVTITRIDCGSGSARPRIKLKGQFLFEFHDKAFSGTNGEDTPLCKALKEFKYLSQINVDVLTKDIPGFKTCDEYKDDWIYEWNDEIPWRFDEHELMEDDDDDIDDLEVYLIRKDPPYYGNDEEEISKEGRCKLHGIP